MLACPCCALCFLLAVLDVIEFSIRFEYLCVIYGFDWIFPPLILKHVIGQHHINYYINDVGFFRSRAFIFSVSLHLFNLPFENGTNYSWNLTWLPNKAMNGIKYPLGHLWCMNQRQERTQTTRIILWLMWIWMLVWHFTVVIFNCDWNR